MDVAEERRAIAVFELAQDWPEATRDSRLSEMLEGEPQLLRIVRAMLRADAALREAYVAIKRDILAAGVGNNREYSERKGKFIIALGYKGAEDA